MAFDEFARSLGQKSRKDEKDRGYIMQLTCTNNDPISVAGADMDIPLLVTDQIKDSSISIGDILLVLKQKNTMTCIGSISKS